MLEVAKASVPLAMVCVPAAGEILTSQIPEAAWLSVAYCPLVSVNEVAPSLAVAPLKTLNVSVLDRPNTSDPAPSSMTATIRPAQPLAVESGTTGADAPD